MLFFKTSLVVAASFLVVLTQANDHRATITTLKNRQSGNSTGSACACKLLTNLFGDQVLMPNATDYEAQATHYWDLRADLSPGCIFLPNTARDVSEGVVILDICAAQFAVRGVGHMPVVGAANTNGGVLIALGGLNTITVGNGSIEIGPGLTWYDVNSALEPYGRIVVGGRLKTIGVAGLTLGGGMSYFSAKYGWTMDTVLAYEVVLGSGAIVTASATSNADLFWALKGGGNNFGIVTKFTLTTYSAPSVSTTIQIFGQNALPQFIGAIADLALYQDQVDTGAGGVFIINSESGNTFQGEFLGVQIGDVEKPAVFENFTATPSEIALYNVTTLVQWSSNLNTPYQTERFYFGMHIALVTNETMQAMYNYWAAAVPKLANITGFASTFVFEPLPPSTPAVSQNNGIGNTWSLPVAPYMFWEIQSQWTNKADDATVQGWAKDTIEAIHAMNLKAGVGKDLIYYNDAADYQDAFASFPPENLAKLRLVRAKYDPTLVFTNLCTGGYKLDHGPIA